MKFSKEMLTLYAVTDRTWHLKNGESLYEQVEKALNGGVTMVQLREKKIDMDSYIEEGISITKLCHRYGVPLIINDSLDVALKCGADGVHVGISDMPVSEIRKIAGKDLIIGATAKTAAQAKKAENEGADYIGVGAIFLSPTKKDAIRITYEELSEIAASVKIPAVAIGGIKLSNIGMLRGCGVKGVAAVSAIFASDNITSSSSELKKTVEDILDL